MIFYFSATGNSQYAAEKIAEATGDGLVSIGQALRDGAFDYTITNDAHIIFAIPTFAYTLPGAVALFIRKLRLTGYAGQPAYGVFTCGASSGSESAALRVLLEEKSIGYNGSFDLVMPDNFIVWSNIPAPARLETMLNTADRALAAIIAAITAKKDGTIGSGMPKDLYMPLDEVSTTKKTSKLYSTDACTACGLCMDICPMRCIQADEAGHPIWEGTCTVCLACLHRCPAAAIQFGKETLGKARYVNPRVKLD